LKKDKKTLLISVFLIYCMFVLWMTIFKRTPRLERKIVFDLFWSFKKFLAGSTKGEKEVVQYFNNILFFIPFGALFPWKKKWTVLFISAFIFSIVIEAVQYIFMLGWCELDDVICNTLGALIGFGLILRIRRWRSKWKEF